MLNRIAPAIAIAAAFTLSACQTTTLATKADNRGQTIVVPVAKYNALKASDPTSHPAFTICGHGASDMQLTADKTAWLITC